MDNQKLTGSYYTPEILSDFLTSHVINKYLKQDNVSILEPSCGDGQFIKSLFKHLDTTSYQRIEIEIIDINTNELKKAKQKVPKNSNVFMSATSGDYLATFLKHKKLYDLIIGNPPYVRKKHMTKEIIELCENCHEIARNESKYINSNFKINNIWTAFIECSILSLSDDGILCFVLPSDILQVNYAKEIRDLIQHSFERVEIFAFNELIFEDIQQDVVAIVAIKKAHESCEKGFSFYQVESLSDLKEPSFTEKYNNIHRTNLNKWTNYILSAEDLDYVESLRNQFQPINNYCAKISAGIVTAANDFFVVNLQKLKKNNLESYEALKPMLLKGSMIDQLINFKQIDFQTLQGNNERVTFIECPAIEKEKLPPALEKYITAAEKDSEKEKGLNQRFKMIERNFWYCVPNTWTSEGLFIKRSDAYPKIIFNAANVLATDSFYRIITKENINIKQLVFSFYNSLTLLLAELEGRFYGGGVLELTPNEFKRLAIPFNSSITEDQFIQLDNMFRQRTNIDQILDFSDSLLLPDLQPIELNKLRALRAKLVGRRKKSIFINDYFVLEDTCQ